MTGAATPHQPPVYMGASLGGGSGALETTTASSRYSDAATTPSSTDGDNASAAPTHGRSETFSSAKSTAQRQQLERILSLGTQCNRCASPSYPTAALSLTQTKSHDPAAIYIDWQPNDPENPFNWSKRQRWFLVLVCFFFTGCTTFNATGYSSAADAVVHDLHTTSLLYLLGNLLHLVAIAYTPMVLAPTSEVFGRRPIFVISTFIYALLYIPQALAPNISAILVSRWFQGMAGSVGNSMAAGVASDLFLAKDRGFAMSLFALIVFVAQGVAPLLTAYSLEAHSWRVAFWWYGAMALLAFFGMFFYMKETRGPVLLSRRARRLTEETGKLHRCRADDERLSFSTMVKISLVRPFQYLFMEPTVTSISLWIAFLWGLVFLSFEAVPIVFAEYGWAPAHQNTTLLVLLVGGILGYCLNFHQEHLYARQMRIHGGKPPPEARLYYACAGAVLVPVGLFIFAWTGRPSVHPAVPIFGLIIFSTALFLIYLSGFSYLADVYEKYASSALAAQSFLRNVLAGCFPLFSTSMYYKLSPPIASTVLASLAAALGIVPFVLMRYGGRIRQHSKAAMALRQEEKEAAEMLAKEEAALRAREQKKLRLEQPKTVAEQGEKGGAAQDQIEKPLGGDAHQVDLEAGRTRSRASALQRVRSDGECDCTGTPSVGIA
ncbi:hypothetical protein ACQY0O_001939 [Thecaphora frezii]